LERGSSSTSPCRGRAGIVTVTRSGGRDEDRQDWGMKAPPDPRYHHVPAEIITHSIWLYHVFSLSLRDVELILAERGVVVSYETVLKRCGAGARNSASTSPSACGAAAHRQSRYLKNRAENSHRPTRRRERQTQRFTSSDQARDFLSAHAFIHGHFHPRRHMLTANSYHAIRTEAFNISQQETYAQQVA
jgi:putative transposase